MLPTEVELLVQNLLESEEFKKGIRKIVDNIIDEGINVSADSIDGLDDAVEDIINKGTFEADTTVSFSA